MGQYYKPIIFNEDESVISLTSYEYDNGAKLTEHSYIGNSFVGAVEYMIEDDPAMVVWAGDYADVEEGKEDNLYYIVEDNDKCINVSPKYFQKQMKKGREHILNMFQKVSDNTRYIINHTKKQYVDKTKCPTTDYDLVLHPLPLLTAEGNQRGGGDYYGNNERLVGAWARDFISVSKKKPTDDYEELVPNFKFKKERKKFTKVEKVSVV